MTTSTISSKPNFSSAIGSQCATGNQPQKSWQRHIYLWFISSDTRAQPLCGRLCEVLGKGDGDALPNLMPACGLCRVTKTGLDTKLFALPGGLGESSVEPLRGSHCCAVWGLPSEFGFSSKQFWWTWRGYMRLSLIGSSKTALQQQN